jgi:hypothetical protein
MALAAPPCLGLRPVAGALASGVGQLRRAGLGYGESLCCALLGCGLRAWDGGESHRGRRDLILRMPRAKNMLKPLDIEVTDQMKSANFPRLRFA